MPSFLSLAVPALALVGSVIANPLKRDDACLAAVTGKAALGDDNLRRFHCSSFIKTVVTPAAVTVTTTITDAPAPITGKPKFKRDVTVCPNEVPNYASACDNAGYKSACKVFGISSETTYTIPATTTTKTVYAGYGTCTGGTATVTSTVTIATGAYGTGLTTYTIGGITTTISGSKYTVTGPVNTVTSTVTVSAGASTVTVGGASTVTVGGAGSTVTVGGNSNGTVTSTVTVSAGASTVTVGGAGTTVTVGGGNGNNTVTSTVTVSAGASTVTVGGGSGNSTVTTTVTVTGSGSAPAGPSAVGKCVTKERADALVAGFIDLLQYTNYAGDNATHTPPGRGYHYNVSADIFDPNFFDVSDSINWMAGFPVSTHDPTKMKTKTNSGSAWLRDFPKQGRL